MWKYGFLILFFSSSVGAHPQNMAIKPHPPSTSLTSLAKISCINNNCLKEGWDTTLQNGVRIETRCLDQSCDVHGWYESSTGKNPTLQAVCESNGCFEAGWSLNHAESGDFIGRIRCTPSEQPPNPTSPYCHDRGWIYITSVKSQLNQSSWGFSLTNATSITCDQHDCKNKGWWILYPTGVRLKAMCNPGGCFSSGWQIINL
ncbi:MAG: hypothetical protein K1X29_05610 [Bdellovibrionales bacterium]|nr:hypothetical protein [Bdellovibrionales bacterium]